MKLKLSTTSRAIAVVFAGMIASAPAFADKPSGAGGGSGKGHSQARNDDVREHRFERDNRVVDRDNRVVVDRDDVRILRNDRVVTSDCPPGQAKKSGYSVGQPLPAGVVTSAVPADILRQLGTLPVGQRYVRVGDDILLLSSGTSAVIDVIRHLGRS